MRAFLFAVSAFAAAAAAAEERMTFSADRVAADNVTRAALATGHVHAACGVLTVRGECMERDADGLMRFDKSTCVTTCTNPVGCVHWSVKGEVEYLQDDHVTLRDCWLEFLGFPVVYLPYLRYPLGTDCGFSWMPGWTSEWGAYLMTKYAYHLLGDPRHEDETYWLKGATRFDVREKLGLALGEDLFWNLDGFGRGRFKVYYAWDESDMYDSKGLRDGDYYYPNWGSTVPRDRYAFEFAHRWEATERDTVRVKGSVFSDSFFQDDFFRDQFFNIANPFLSYSGNEAAWEHLESAWSAGVSVSGPLNSFRAGTARLPEIYLDLNPVPVFGTPFLYESENRIGYMARRAAEYGRYSRPYYPYGYDPGPWAEYDTFRLDTYHRVSLPFRTFGDTVSAVPRLGYRGTYWNQCGGTDLTGFDVANVGSAGGGMYRSIPEAGITFSARGSGWLDDGWRHVLEPYADVLAQHASYDGASGARRPYVFDNLDASVMWEDQFAGRSRNLPYTYYGVTPGLRQLWQRLDDKGSLRTVLEADAYAALQFNSAEWYEAGSGTFNDRHRLAVPGSPNYGESGCTVVPGGRIRWRPDDDISLAMSGEYDSGNNRVATANAVFSHRVSKTFKYNADYRIRDFRWWDYSSSPYWNGPNPLENGRRVHMESDDFNLVHCQIAGAGFEYQPIDWFRFSPFLKWDLYDSELDCAGAWFDYLFDCIGFRLILAYRSKYTAIDGYEHRDHFNIGFVVFLRALGDDGTNIFTN